MAAMDSLFRPTRVPPSVRPGWRGCGGGQSGKSPLVSVIEPDRSGPVNTKAIPFGEGRGISWQLAVGSLQLAALQFAVKRSGEVDQNEFGAGQARNDKHR